MSRFDEGIASEYRDNTYDFEDGTDGFIKYLDKIYTMPNSKEKRVAGLYLEKDCEWLFTFLAQNPETQGMEQIMRYIMFKYTGKDYGVTELDFSIFDPNYSLAANGIGTTKSFIHYFEGTKEEGGKYVVYLDSGNNRTVGYGVNIEAQGWRFQAKGIDPSTIKPGDKLDKELVDSIEDEIIAEKQQEIEAITSGLNLKPYQITALTSRYYNCGNLKGFKEAYLKYWKESDDEYGVKENSSMYQHPLYTNYMSKPIKDNKGNTLPGLVNRRKAEWILFKTGYYISSNDFYEEGGEIIAWAKNVHKYMEANSYIYSLNTSVLATTFEGSKSLRRSCCATYVSWVLQEAGYLSDSEHTDSTSALARILTGKGFQKITNRSDMQPGDVIIYEGHTEIYAGDNTVYNAGSTNAIQSSSPQRRKDWSTFKYALRAR